MWKGLSVPHQNPQVGKGERDSLLKLAKIQTGLATRREDVGRSSFFGVRGGDKKNAKPTAR